MKLTKKITLALGLAIGSFSFAQTYPLSENFWTSPEFQDRVMGSYGMHTGLEPKINEEEGLLFKELLVLLDQNMELGRDRLKNAITPESSAALSFMLGTVNLQLGDIDASVDAYKAAIKKFPNFMRAYKSAGYALAQSNQYEEATKYLVKGMELGGADGTTCGLLGYCYLNLDKYGAALNAYNLAMAYEPDTADWQLGKVRCLIYMQAYAEAQGLIEDLLIKDLNNSELWLHQANTKLAMDLSKEAATNLEVVRRMGKASLASLTLLGDIYANRAMHGLAFDVYSEALDRSDGIKAVRKARRLAGSLVQYEEYEYANKISEKVMARFESEMEKEQIVDFLNLKAEVALATEDSEEAAETLNQIVEVDPMNGQALILLAKHAWNKGDVEEAEFLFERASSVDEVAVKALLQHGQMLVQSRDYTKAAAVIRKSLDLKYSQQVADYLRDVEEAARMSL